MAKQISELSKVPLIPEFVHYVAEQGIDDYGKVFTYGENMYRAINREHAALVASYFSSGLIAELEKRELIPHTEITPYVLDDHTFYDYAFVLKHEKIGNVSSISEWSFSMIQDACILVLDLIDVLLDYGYALKDSHYGNILFKNNKPVWIDITSFIKLPNNQVCVYPSPMQEWVTTIYQQVQFMSMNPIAARSHLMSSLPKNDLILNLSYIKNKLSVNYTGGGDKKYIKFLNRYVQIINRAGLTNDKVKIHRAIEVYKRRIKQFKFSLKTQWSGYDWVRNGEIAVSEKHLHFLKVFHMIAALPIHSVTEFGCNDGLFSCMLAQLKQIDRIIATDYDENCIDNLYRLLSSDKAPRNCAEKIFPMIINFCDISHQSSLVHGEKSDAVVAMALTHHLLLAQHMNIDDMFKKFASFTKKGLFIEFMPLGLWDGRNAPPIPRWYTEEYFVRKMSIYFNIYFREQLEENRILFYGELKN